MKRSKFLFNRTQKPSQRYSATQETKQNPLVCGMYFVTSFQRVDHREEVRRKISSDGDESCCTHNQDDVPQMELYLDGLPPNAT